MENYSQSDANIPQVTETIVNELEKFTIAKGNPPSDADCEVSMLSRNTSPVPEWPKEAPDPVLYDVLSPRIRIKYRIQASPTPMSVDC